jgi:Bacterial antitoxin of ParD toxin-antitoxin type II system and RHH
MSQFLSEMSVSGDTEVAMSENTSFSVGEHFREFVDEQVREGRRSSASDGN